MVTGTRTHTPGPWIVSPARFDRPVSAGPVTFTFYVRAPDRQGDSQSVLDEAHANARLIATAPDLLEAVEYFVGIAEHTPVIWENLPANILPRFRAAIAKAEGKE